MTAIPVQQAGTRAHAASMVLLGLAGGVVAADAVAASLAGLAARDPLTFLTFLLAMIGMLLAGAALVRDRRHEGLGRLLLGIAGAGALFDLLGVLLDVGPAAFLQGFFYWLYAALIVHLVVRWPDARISGRVARALVVTAYVLPAVLSALWQLTWDPRWFPAEEADRWWLTLVPARDLSAIVWQAQQLLFVALIAALLVVVIARAAAARGARLAAIAPVVLVAVVLAATVVIQIVQTLGAPIEVDVDVVQNLVLLAVPVAVLIAALRAPASMVAPVAPGRRSHLDDRARERYRLGLAMVVAGLVVVITVMVAISSGGWPDSPPAPQPGPQLVVS